MLLEGNSLDPAIIAWLEHDDQKCRSMKCFANWVDTKAELERTILANVDSVKTNRGQLANLKQAWREAEGMVASRLKRASEGLNEETIEEPLQWEVQKNVEKVFSSSYGGWLLAVEEMGADAILARFSREFGKKQPSMYTIMRAKSIAHSQRSVPTKRHKVAANVDLEVRDGADADEAVDSVVVTSLLGKYFKCFKIVRNTWAVAGCFDVMPEGETTSVKYVHWQQACEYMQEFQDHADELLTRYDEESVLIYIVTVEEKFRAKAISYARSPQQVPWGRALLQALAKESRFWQDHRDLLAPKRGYGASAAMSRVREPMTPDRKELRPPLERRGKGEGKSEGKALNLRNFATITETKQGWSVCKAHNDQRGCGQYCNFGKVHVCDVLLASGQGCESKGHTRLQHDPLKHGEVMRK